MWRVKRTSRVVGVSLPSSHVADNSVALSSPNERELEGDWEAGGSQCCGRLDNVCIRSKTRSQGSLLSLPLWHRAGTRHWTKPGALLCSQQAGLAFTPCCRHGPLRAAQHIYTALLQSAQVFFLAAGLKITVLPARGCLERPWHYGGVTVK